MNYRYKIYETNGNSGKYGNCECCKKYASNVFHQVEEREYQSADGGGPGWTSAGCSDLFGHLECLVKQQRGEDKKIQVKGYSIVFNEIFGEWQYSHPEIGLVGNSKNLQVLIEEAIKG